MLHSETAAMIRRLEQVLQKSPKIRELLVAADQLGLPNWYLGAGAIAQTVWNDRHGYELDYGIKDYDLVYFDDDISQEAQEFAAAKIKERLKKASITVEVTNEARVHLWYEQEFGKAIQPYISTEDAINSWPTTATSIGVRRSGGGFIVYAPYGLSDLMNFVIRPNKALVTREVYAQKVARWKAVWPKLTIMPWGG